MTDRYAVIGQPVDHSLSPRIHHAFAAQLSEDIEYCKLPAAEAAFEATCSEFFAAGGAGLNVTLPFKERAYQWVLSGGGTCDEAAARAKAVNTLVRNSGGFRGCNTDGIGFMRDLERNHSASLAATRVLVLGAGGAARGILGPLLARGLQSLTVANRTVARAEDLAAEFPGVSASSLADVKGTFDLVINATSAGVAPALDGSAADGLIESSVILDALCYDLFYDLQAPTAFCAWAMARGARNAHDGLGMLVEQAAEAYFLWRGTRPATREVIRRLRDPVARRL